MPFIHHDHRPPQFGGHFHVFQESLEVLINEEPIQCIGKKISFKELVEVGYELLEIDVDTGAADELDPYISWVDSQYL